MSIINSLEAIENSPRGTARIDCIKAHSDEKLRELLRLACSPLITFGIKKIPEIFVFAASQSDDEWYRGLVSLLALLQKRELTGNAAEEAVVNFLSKGSELQSKWAARVISKDLRLNVGAKEIDKAMPGLIPIFDVPLATDLSKVSTPLSGEWVLQPKLDGARCVAIIPSDVNKPIELFTRTGKKWLNFGQIVSALEQLRKTAQQTQDLVLDGEVVVEKDGKIDFQGLQTVLFSKTEPDLPLVFHVFDACSVDEWFGNGKEPYTYRLSRVESLVRGVRHDKIRPISSRTVFSPSKQDLTEECAKMIELGFEGAMARKGGSPIERKRTKNLIKIKTFVDAEAKIVQIIPGTGKLQNLMGAILCSLPNGVTFEIGTGFDDAQRLLFVTENFVGRTVTFKYQELTNEGVPRFPVFKGFRNEDELD